MLCYFQVPGIFIAFFHRETSQANVVKMVYIKCIIIEEMPLYNVKTKTKTKTFASASHTKRVSY